MPKHPLEPDKIASARRRLRRCEAGVELLRTLLTELPPRSPAYAVGRSWLHELERSCFCRRLELDELLRARRVGPELNAGEQGQVIPFRALGRGPIR
jgi:hypothetical protein